MPSARLGCPAQPKWFTLGASPHLGHPNRAAPPRVLLRQGPGPFTVLPTYLLSRRACGGALNGHPGTSRVRATVSPSPDLVCGQDRRSLGAPFTWARRAPP